MLKVSGNSRKKQGTKEHSRKLSREQKVQLCKKQHGQKTVGEVNTVKIIVHYFGKEAECLPSTIVFQTTQTKESVNMWTLSMQTSAFLIKTGMVRPQNGYSNCRQKHIDHLLIMTKMVFIQPHVYILALGVYIRSNSKLRVIKSPSTVCNPSK